jgi:hypothetical protein
MKKDHIRILVLILLIFSGLNLSAQDGRVNLPGGGTTFSAEQYKIDRMKRELKPNTNLPSSSRATSTTTNKPSGNSSSTYEPGSGWRTSTRVWREKKYELDYRRMARKAKAKETKGLDFDYPKDKGVEVTHTNDGIAVFDNTVFHDHKKEYQEYNNLYYDLNYSFREAVDSSFGFGLLFNSHNSSFHDCKEYTFLSFFITAAGDFMFYKKKMGKADKFTSGFFPELQDDVPGIFELEKYTKAAKKITNKEINQLGVVQWENELVVIVNNEIIYQDGQSKCPVQLNQTPYNIFLNKGTVIFFDGEEIYVEKKHAK